MMNKRIIFLLLFFFLFSFLGWSFIQKDKSIQSQMENNDKIHEEKYKIKTGNDMTIYTTTDIHYLAKDLTDDGEAYKKYVASGDGKQLQYINEIINAFTYEIENKKPDILIISGDLTNNGEKESHIELSKKINYIEENGTSVYVIPGNHDISNPWARSFKGDKQYVTESINEKEFSEIYANFGYDEAISKDENTLSYLAAPSEDLWLLMLDTNKYKNNDDLGKPQTDGELSQDTLDWIQKCSALAREEGATILTVMHHNILNHSDAIEKGFTLNNNKETLELFKKNRLNLVLSGHIHIQDISSYKNGADTQYDIATGSLTMNPHQYGILKYSFKNNSIDYDTSRVDVENWSKEKGIIDKNINHFRDYSEEYFGKFSYNMAYKQLSKEKGYSESEIRSMSKIMEILNKRYFAGTENLNSKDVMTKEGYKLWSDAPDGFLKSYMMSISKDNDTDDNYLHIQMSKE
jgi:3',5'-cyclic AMP phosphodiesterase CpdA